MQSGPSNLPTGYSAQLNEGVAPEQQIGLQMRRQTYDANGRVTMQRSLRSDGTLEYDIAYSGVDRNSLALGYDAAAALRRKTTLR